MSPLIDWYLNQLATHGLARVIAAQAGLCVAAWCALGATLHVAEQHRSLKARRTQLRTERQQMAHLRHAIDTAPQIPTQPGTDDQLLDACEAAWNATEPRKETP